MQQATSRAWKNGAEKYLLTLQRADNETAWGFSCSGGQDLEAWGGLMSGKMCTVNIEIVYTNTFVPSRCFCEEA